MSFIDLSVHSFLDEIYEQAIESLFNQIPSFQQVGVSAYKPGLDASINFDKVLDFPSTSFPSIHIAGTNGKGSVSNMLAAILQQQGYKVGLYTSPHLIDFRERVRLNGEMVPKEFVFDFLKKWGDYIIVERISFFEITTALAFDYFRASGVDIAIIETGLGGRLDSTNIINPKLSIITNIALDHCIFLGNSIEEIAREKAGIIKSGVPVIIGEGSHEYSHIFSSVAGDMKSPIYFAEKDFHNLLLSLGVDSINELEYDLKGDYQKVNIKTVLATVFILRDVLEDNLAMNISNDAILLGLKNVVKLTGLRGRWETISQSPRIICDTGHNAHGLRYVFNQLRAEDYDRLFIVFGVVADKDLDSIKALMPKDAYYIFTQTKGVRALKASVLANILMEDGFEGEVVSEVGLALNRAKELSKENDLIFVGGSTFVVGEMMEVLDS